MIPRPAQARLLTPPSPGAVATLQVIGPSELQAKLAEHFVPCRAVDWTSTPINRVTYGTWGREFPEDVVVCRTSETTTEIHCHGGRAAIERILQDLEMLGISRPGTGDALTESDGSLADECRQSLIAATTLRAADLLLPQAKLLGTAIAGLLQTTPAEALAQIDELLRWGSLGCHLTDPWTIVLCGRPNVGKSSLINTLLGYSRAIVCDLPGTTRDLVTAQAAFDGWPVELVDTAGLRDTADSLEGLGIERARQRMESADLRLVLLDTSQPPQDDDWQLLQDMPDALLVAHKSDLPGCWGDCLPSEAIAVSSLTGEGVDDLARAIVGRLVPNVPTPATPLPVNRRQVALLSQARDLLLRVSDTDTSWHAPLQQMVTG